MIVTLIAAVASNRVIGRDGDLPWRLPDDMKFFKNTTMGHHVIMGRRTWDSLRKPLPGRTNVVLSRSLESAEGARVVRSFHEAIDVAEAAGDDEVFVIGGAMIYALALARADRLVLTLVDAAIDGDVLFPETGDEWNEVKRVPHPADDRHAHAFAFTTWHRVGATAPFGSRPH